MVSQASPIPLSLASICEGLKKPKQLSNASKMPSSSRSSQIRTSSSGSIDGATVGVVPYEIEKAKAVARPVPAFKRRVYRRLEVTTAVVFPSNRKIFRFPPFRLCPISLSNPWRLSRHQSIHWVRPCPFAPSRDEVQRPGCLDLTSH